MQRASDPARFGVPRQRFSMRIRRKGLFTQVACLGQQGHGVRPTPAALREGLLMPLHRLAQQLVHYVITIRFSHHL